MTDLRIYAGQYGDGRWVARSPLYPRLDWKADTREEAIEGLGRLIAEVQFERKNDTRRGPVFGLHGTTTGYSHGCRCDLCRGAKTNYQRQRRARQAREKVDA